MSLSRLNHRYPRVHAHPEIVQGATEFHHQLTGARLPQAAPVLHDTAALDPAVDLREPPPPLVARLVRPVWLPLQLLAAGFLGRHEAPPPGSVNARPPSAGTSRLPAAKGYGGASAMGFSWGRPPSVALRKRMRRRAWTHKPFCTVWSLFCPL